LSSFIFSVSDFISVRVFMCDAVSYVLDAENYKIHFRDGKAKLPVRMRDGKVRLLTWGRRKREQGNLPLGGWARLASVQKGAWNKFFPRPVKLSLLGFMMMDGEGQPQWFDMVKGQCLQGLLARYDREHRVYIVCVLPEGVDEEFCRWPRVVNDLWGKWH
jgi:hypothetical protein